MRNISRTRRTVAVLASLAATVALAACGSSDDSSSGSDSSGKGSVTFAAYGGTGQEAETKAYLDPFAEESGVKVNQDDPVSWAKVDQMVKADNVTWDVVQGGTSQGVEDNPQLEDIDCTVVDCDAFASTAFPAYKQAVPLFVFSYVLAYNKDAFDGKTAPASWKDFFDPSIKGQRDVMPTSSGWQGLLEAALLTDGVSRDDLYPLDVDRALKVIGRIKDQMVVMPTDDQCVNDVASGEAIMATCYNGRVGLGITSGQNIGIAWGQQIQFCDYLYIPKGTKNLENAQKLVAYIVDNEGAIGNYIGYSGVNPTGLKSDSEFADFLPGTNAEEGDMAPIVPDLDWWNENMDATIKAVTAWVAS
jgi:putative spermidine/putrescine transport system substrate-binding protein